MSQTPPSPDPLVLDRYLAAEATADEVRLVEQWLADNPQERAALRVLHAGMAEQGGHLPPYDHNARVAAVVDYSARAARRNRQQGTPDPFPRQRDTQWHTARSKHGARWYVVAGLAVAIVCLVAGVTQLSHHHRSVPVVTYATANGERGTVTLTDGSTVTLNAASRLEVPADYAAGNRTVRLIGEGLFAVSNHAGHPFTVISGSAKTRVLGTSFIVRHYGTDTTTMVAVRTGKVSVGSTVVPAGRLAEIDSAGITQLSRADTALFGFAHGVLAVRNTTLARAIPDLDRWYDADIRLGDTSLASKPIDGYITAGSINDLTERLAVLFNVRVVRDGRTLTLYPR